MNNSVIATNKYGVAMRLNPREIIDSTVIRFGYFDDEVMDAMLKHLNDNDILWDVGANVGLHALTVRKMRPGVACYCFEPYPPNFNRLVVNNSLNPGAGTFNYNFGLSDKAGVHEMHVTDNNHGRTGFSVMGGMRSPGTFVMAVDGDFLAASGMPTPTAMKIDTEGHELAVLKGCRSLLKERSLRFIVFEALEDIDAITELLKDYSFRVSPIDNQSNFIAVRV
jgi:FkbM family methyltransferase